MCILLCMVTGATADWGPVMRSMAAAESSAFATDVRFTPWGDNAVRVQVARPGHTVVDGVLSPLLPRPQAASMSCADGPITHGNLRVECSSDGATRRAYRVSDGALLLVELTDFVATAEQGQVEPPLKVVFGCGASEVYGLGQQRQTCYPEGGRQAPSQGKAFAPGEVLTYTLAAGEGGAANTLPWLYGATVGVGADWGLWVNLPSTGNLTLDATVSDERSVAFFFDAAVQLDYVVTTHSAASRAVDQSFEMVERFTEWVGRSPGLPEWALGYWHSKNRFVSRLP